MFTSTISLLKNDIKNVMTCTPFREKKIVIILLPATLITSIKKNASCIIHLDLKHTTCVRPIILSAK